VKRDVLLKHEELIYIPATKVKKSWCDILLQTHFNGRTFVITRHYEPFIALVSIEDLELLLKTKDKIQKRQKKAVKKL